MITSKTRSIAGRKRLTKPENTKADRGPIASAQATPETQEKEMTPEKK
jgi:hypothetical protein